MCVGPVVEDVAEDIDVRFDGLRPEEIVRHETDAARHVWGHVVLGSADHIGKVLHGKGQMGVHLGEGDADVASRAADVDDGPCAAAANNERPGIVLGQEAGGEAEAIGEGGHGKGEALSHVGVSGIVLPYRLVGVLGQAPAGFVGFIALELLPRLDGPRERLPHLVKHVSKPGLGVCVFRELARGGRVRDVSFARFMEDAVVCYGEADDPSEVGFGHAAFPGQIGEGDLAVDGDVGGDVIFVDCLQAHTVQLRVKTLSAKALRFVVSAYLPPAEGTWLARGEADGAQGWSRGLFHGLFGSLHPRF